MHIYDIVDRFQIECRGKDKIFSNLGKLDSDLPDLLSFVEDEVYLQTAGENKNILALVTKKQFAKVNPNITLLFSNQPRHTFYLIHEFLSKNTDFYCKKTKNIIHPSARIHFSSFIAGSNIEIGKNVVIGPNVCIYEGTKIAENVEIKPGAIIGSCGFEYYKIKGEMFPVTHAGGVEIKEGVSIGANTCIDRAIFKENTYIGEYSKIDNLVHIGHGVKIGKRVMIPAGVVIAGFVKIGNDSWIGVGSVILQRLKIGSNVLISIGSVVTKDVSDNAHVTGNFAIDHNKFIKSLKQKSGNL